MTDIATAIVWLAGSAFALLAAVGVLRMPDVFTRMQASTKASTLGLACLLIGAALLPLAIGTIVGDRLHDRLDPRAFRRAIGVLLVVSGAALLVIH